MVEHFYWVESNLIAHRVVFTNEIAEIEVTAPAALREIDREVDREGSQTTFRLRVVVIAVDRRGRTFGNVQVNPRE